MRRARFSRRKLLASAAFPALLAGSASPSTGVVSIDVRLPGGGKNSTLSLGETVPLEIYLVGGDMDLANGLGQFTVGVRSFNEVYNQGSPPNLAWPVARAPNDTAANASGGSNATDPLILDLNFAHGTNADATTITGNPDPNDTDIDRISIGGTQSAANGWDPAYGKVHEVLLGTAQFTQLYPNPRGIGFEFDLNAYYTNNNGAGSGAVVRTLTGSDTETNAVSTTNLITSSAQIGSPVHVTVYDIAGPTFRWDGGPGGTGTQWLAAANWFERITGAEHIPQPTDRAVFGYNTNTPPPTVGIDFSSPLTNNGPANVVVGGIDSYSSTTFTIINSSATPGTLTLASNFLLSTNTGMTNAKVTIGGSGGPMVIALEQSGTINVFHQTSTIEVAVPITGAGKNITKVGNGLLIFSGGNTYSGTTTVGGGKLLLAASQTSSSSFTVTGGATAELKAGASVVLKTGSIATTGSDKVDVKDNKLILTASSVGEWNGSAYTGVTGQVQAGRNGGAWNGGKIVTSMSDANVANQLTTLAVAEAGSVDKTTFGDEPVAETDVLVMYTYDGDATLSGDIDGDDYFRIDAGYATRNDVTPLLGYANGDFNYSGNVDVDDYFIIDRNYFRQGEAFSPSAPAGITAVPEPSGLIVMGISLAFARRRRRS